MDKITQEIDKILGITEAVERHESPPTHYTGKPKQDYNIGGGGLPSITFHTFIKWQLNPNTKEVSVTNAFTSIAKTTKKTKKQPKKKLEEVSITDEEKY